MKASLSAAALATIASTAAAELIPGTDYGYGNWTGGAYTFDETGMFSHCAVSALFRSGDTLFISVNSDSTVSVAVANPNLGLTPGESVPVALQVDSRAPFGGTAKAVSADFAVLVIPEFARALDALRLGRTLTINTASGQRYYDLTGTNRALIATYECARQNLNYRAQPAQKLADVDLSVLYQVATGMIADIGVKDFEYLSEDEAKDVFDGPSVVWLSRAQGITGGVLLLSGDGVPSLRDTDGDDIAFLGKGCDGDAATTSRDLSLADGTEAREIRMLCAANAGSFETLLTKVRVANRVLYTLLRFEDGARIQSPEDRIGISENAAFRAASFVREQAD